jgi:hypothetical protein
MPAIATEARVASMLCWCLSCLVCACCGACMSSLFSYFKGGSKGKVLRMSSIYVKWGSVLSYPIWLSILILVIFSLTLSLPILGCHALFFITTQWRIYTRRMHRSKPSRKCCLQRHCQVEQDFWLSGVETPTAHISDTSLSLKTILCPSC